MASGTQTLKNYINNEYVAAQGEGTLELQSPVTEEIIAISPISNEADVNAAVAAAKEAFKTWRRTTPSERQACLLKLADALEEHGREIAEIQSRETGQLIAMVESEECGVGADQLRFFAGAARVLSGLPGGRG